MKAVGVENETIFSLLKADSTRSVASWLWLWALALTGWVGAVAFLGQYRHHEVAEALYTIGSPSALYIGSVLVSLGLLLTATVAKRRALAGAALCVTALLVGHQLYAWLYPYVPARIAMPFRSNSDALQFATARLTYSISVVLPMLAPWVLLFRKDGWPPLRLGWGNMQIAGRHVDRSETPRPWWRLRSDGMRCSAWCSS